jgi:hypothetical protein
METVILHIRVSLFNISFLNNAAAADSLHVYRFAYIQDSAEDLVSFCYVVCADVCVLILHVLIFLFLPSLNTVPPLNINFPPPPYENDDNHMNFAEYLAL